MAESSGEQETFPDNSISASEFRTNCASILNKVAADGREIVVERRGTPVAKIVPATHGRVALRGLLVGLVDIPPDTDIDAMNALDDDWHEKFLATWDEELAAGALRIDNPPPIRTA